MIPEIDLNILKFVLYLIDNILCVLNKDNYVNAI
jgi:hypothetical protein